MIWAFMVHREILHLDTILGFDWIILEQFVIEILW